MERYRKFSPTPFDTTGLAADRLGIGDWFVAPVSRTRDSGCLAESNFHSTLKALGGESDTVEVHRFGHWGPGWFELILIHPDSPQMAIAEEIENALADYPVVDESDWSEREWDAKHEYWTACTLAERVALCQRARCSIFAARQSDIPHDSRIDEYISLDE